MPMSLPLIIPPERDAQWRRIIAARREYWQLYSFIAERLRGSAEIALSAATKVQLHDTRVWYDSAAAINNPASRRFIHFFARAYLCAEAYRQTCIEVEPWGTAVQRNSDALGEQVRGQILETGGRAIPSFEIIGPVDTRAITETLLAGRRLERTVWPAYAQWASMRAERHFGRRMPRLLGWLRLLDLLSPAETFDDVSFMDDLSADEKSTILRISEFCARYARLCAAAGDWDRDFFALLRRYLARGSDRAARHELF